MSAQPGGAHSGWDGVLIDAYAHIGVPKYGSLADVSRCFRRLQIERGVLVLGQ